MYRVYSNLQEVILCSQRSFREAASRVAGVIQRRPERTVTKVRQEPPKPSKPAGGSTSTEVLHGIVFWATK